MSVLERCQICGGTIWNFSTGRSPHTCPPAWWCCADTTGFNYTPYNIYAATASDAAEKYARSHDAREMEYKEYQDVYVRPRAGGQLQKFDVRMEMEPVYSVYGQGVDVDPEVEVVDSEAEPEDAEAVDWEDNDEGRVKEGR